MDPLYRPSIALSRPLIGAAEIEAVDEVLRSGQLANGPQLRAFEAELAAYCGLRFAVAVSSGTAALELSLRALGVGPGDEVIVPSLTFIATANAVALLGARPVFADIDRATMCVSPATVEGLMSPATAAVVAVHLFGHPAPADELARLCREREVALIEDGAQALGARWRERQVGSFGRVGAFSFYATKAVTTGEGGAVVSDDPELDARLRRLRNHGADSSGVHHSIGTNARMSELAAALGRVQLRELDARNDARRAHAQAYDRALDGLVERPSCAPGAVHAYHHYTVRVDDRARLLAALERAGVGYGLYYPRPCHMQPAFGEAGGRALPETERAAARVVSIPVRPDLDEAEREAVIAAIRDGVGEGPGQ